MNDQQWQQLNARLAGIELPPEPDWWPLTWSVAAIALSTLILVLVIRQKRKLSPQQTPAAEAAHRLQQLQHAWQTGELEARDAAYQIATLLRLGLGLRQLEPTPPPQLAHQAAEWHALLSALAQLRYQPQREATLSEQTFNQIREWLQC